MSATADRPDDPKRATFDTPGVPAHDFTLLDGNGNLTRWVLKTPETLRANRAVLCDVYGCPDEWLDEVLEYALKHLDA